MNSIKKMLCGLFRCSKSCPKSCSSSCVAKKHSYQFNSGLINSEWLSKNMTNVKILDCSWSPDPTHKPSFSKMRIPGSQYFDINACCDKTSDLPHMLPPLSQFNDYCEGLGISNNDKIVIYDDTGLTAPRLWWTFKVLANKTEVAILDGGLFKWKSENRDMEMTSPSAPTRGHFTGVDMAKDYAVDIKYVKERIALCEQKKLTYSVIDARSAGRFAGKDPEPRPIPSGHMPFSKNLFFGDLLIPQNDYKLLKSPYEINELFTKLNIDLKAEPIILSCGSGCTASTLAFGLYLIGRTHPGAFKVYDGSWSEWAANTSENPIING